MAVPWHLRDWCRQDSAPNDSLTAPTLSASTKVAALVPLGWPPGLPAPGYSETSAAGAPARRPAPLGVPAGPAQLPGGVDTGNRFPSLGGGPGPRQVYTHLCRQVIHKWVTGAASHRAQGVWVSLDSGEGALRGATGRRECGCRWTPERVHSEEPPGAGSVGVAKLRRGCTQRSHRAQGVWVSLDSGEGALRGATGRRECGCRWTPERVHSEEPPGAGSVGVAKLRRGCTQRSHRAQGVWVSLDSGEGALRGATGRRECGCRWTPERVHSEEPPGAGSVGVAKLRRGCTQRSHRAQGVWVSLDSGEGALRGATGRRECGCRWTPERVHSEEPPGAGSVGVAGLRRGCTQRSHRAQGVWVSLDSGEGALEEPPGAGSVGVAGLRGATRRSECGSHGTPERVHQEERPGASPGEPRGGARLQQVTQVLLKEVACGFTGT
ncbi:hypothetical protein NDU88_000909 [Pleurodeles waltl]|uniref:Uncharacterized protein n=1 Tax=Pleurodeles waltl TaxID=8319 RepID=A0AAV7P549_PLEWA|nr:hypothetical protein NDU88_000909 [Pleurodeles waltl]